MNSSVSVELLEQELLRTQDTSFYFGFATTQYPELEIEKDKKHHHYINYTDSEHKEFYARCEDICNMEVINIPLYNFMFSELGEAIKKDVCEVDPKQTPAWKQRSLHSWRPIN